MLTLASANSLLMLAALQRLASDLRVNQHQQSPGLKMAARLEESQMLASKQPISPQVSTSDVLLEMTRANMKLSSRMSVEPQRPDSP